MTLRFAILVLAGVSAFPSGTGIAQDSNGFTVRHEVLVAGAPARVFAASTKEVGRWWNPEHTFTGDSRNLSIDARPGGCFCEKFPKGGGIEHLRVVYVVPGEILRMVGGLGPLQEAGTAGSFTWKVSAAGDSSRVEWTYVVGGYIEGGFEPIAPIVSQVLGEQLERLKRFVETGQTDSRP